MHDQRLVRHGDRAGGVPVEVERVSGRALVINGCKSGGRVVSPARFGGDDHVGSGEMFLDDLATRVVCKPRGEHRRAPQTSKGHSDVRWRTSGDFACIFRVRNGRNDVNERFADGENMRLVSKIHGTSFVGCADRLRDLYRF